MDLGVALALWLGACGERARTGEEASPPAAAAEGAEAVGMGPVPDTANPVAYRIFDQVVETASPKRILLRLLVFDFQNRDGVTKALRIALDSVARRDTQLVAARAVVYGPRMRGPQEADLVPFAWAFWLPPQGWDSASAISRKRIHRTHVYFDAPPEPRWADGPTTR